MAMNKAVLKKNSRIKQNDFGVYEYANEDAWAAHVIQKHIRGHKGRQQFQDMVNRVLWIQYHLHHGEIEEAIELGLDPACIHPEAEHKGHTGEHALQFFQEADCEELVQSLTPRASPRATPVATPLGGSPGGSPMGGQSPVDPTEHLTEEEMKILGLATQKNELKKQESFFNSLTRQMSSWMKSSSYTGRSKESVLDKQSSTASVDINSDLLGTGGNFSQDDYEAYMEGKQGAEGTVFEPEPEDKFGAAHILLKTSDTSSNPTSRRTNKPIKITFQEAMIEAEEMLQTLTPQTFAEVAKLRSDCGSFDNGGDLGQFGPNVMHPTFEATVRQLQQWEISRPVETDAGLHLVMRTM